MAFARSGKFEAPTAVNPYLADVAEVAELNDPTESFTIDVPAKEQSRHELFVRSAANAAGKTARLRSVDTSNRTVVGQTEKGRDIVEGTVALKYTLTEQHKAGKGRKSAEGEATPAKGK